MKHPLHRITLSALCLATAGSASGQEALQLRRADHHRFQAAAHAPAAMPCRGIAIISPGAGGSEKGYGYLGEALSSLGYLAVVVGHPESGRRALREQVRGQGLREGLADLITDPQAYHGRFLDIAASVRWAESRCASTEKLLIGHSMGAATAMLEAGAANLLGVKGSDAFKAYITLSPQGVGAIFPENAWAGIRKPVLMLTGTRDTELGGASWETRTTAFSSMPPGCKWLGVIDGASHMNFAGNGASRRTEALTARTISAFVDALGRGDCLVGPPQEGIRLTTK
ncbi:MAG: alpha/beta hydrolase [Rubrivivax sp.]|jgi:predicted dienelactone hydrolase|nr:alpha/beta hydrolase [Rubrivivax sp.]